MAKTVWITGSSRGIGRALAKEYYTAGYQVVLHGRKSSAALTDFYRELVEAAPHLTPPFIVIGDISSYKEVERMLSEILSHFHGIHLWINNAGISFQGVLQSLSPQEWNQIIQTNLSSLFYTCSQVIPVMLQQGEGYILNISSVWGNMGASCEVAYSASKGGVNAFTKALAKELAPSRIPVNAIAPGLVDTSMNKNLSSAELKNLVQEIPAGRMGTPSEIAAFARKLTESTPYLTGQILTLDGGWI